MSDADDLQQLITAIRQKTGTPHDTYVAWGQMCWMPELNYPPGSFTPIDMSSVNYINNTYNGDPMWPTFEDYVPEMFYGKVEV